MVPCTLCHLTVVAKTSCESMPVYGVCLVTQAKLGRSLFAQCIAPPPQLLRDNQAGELCPLFTHAIPPYTYLILTLAGMWMKVNAFKRTDDDFYEAVHRPEEPESDAGTTALAALIAGDALLVANAGDCRAVMCRRGRAIDLSRDHNAESEAERVKAAGAAAF